MQAKVPFEVSSLTKRLKGLDMKIELEFFEGAPAPNPDRSKRYFALLDCGKYAVLFYGCGSCDGKSNYWTTVHSGFTVNDSRIRAHAHAPRVSELTFCSATTKS